MFITVSIFLTKGCGSSDIFFFWFRVESYRFNSMPILLSFSVDFISFIWFCIYSKIFPEQFKLRSSYLILLWLSFFIYSWVSKTIFSCLLAKKFLIVYLLSIISSWILLRIYLFFACYCYLFASIKRWFSFLILLA